MRRLLLSLSTAAALVALAQPVEAQFRFGLEGAVLTALDELPQGTKSGTFGIGPRVVLSPPLFPLGVVGQGVYYFPKGDGSYLTYSLAALLRLPLPLVEPYAIGGWQWRRSSVNNQSSTENGFMIGAGVQLNLGVGLFLEGTYESHDKIEAAPDLKTSPFVIKGGVLLGG